jgi:ornithine cyclodeaminase
MRQITNQEVLASVSLADAEAILRYAYAGMQTGLTGSHQRLRTLVAGARLSTLGGSLPQLGYLGSKTYATCNGKNGFAILLFSSETALPVAVLQGEGVTQLKGSVTTALVADVLAKPEADTVAIFGTGIQAHAHVASLKRVRKLKRINVVSRNRADDFVRWIEAEHGLEARQTSPDIAASSSDIIVTATRASTPLFDGSALRPGTFISAIGTSTLTAREVDVTTVQRADLIGVEWKLQAQAEAGDLATGVNWDAAHELGGILGNDALRHNAANEIRLFKSTGIGLADVAIAVAAYARITGSWDELAKRMTSADAAQAS